MKLSEIFQTLKPFAAVAASAIPGGPALVAAANVFLKDEDKLPVTATGSQIEQAINNLPPEQRSSLMEKEIDLQIAQEEGWTDRYKAMCSGDEQSTRPVIAKWMAKVLIFEICSFTLWAFVHPQQMNNPVLWTVFGTLTGVPASILLKYFGELRREQGQRLGLEPKNILGGLFGART